MSWAKLVLNISLILFLLLLLLLGESYISTYLIGLGALIFISFGWINGAMGRLTSVDWWDHSRLMLLVMWLLYLAVLIVSAIVSTSIPLSLVILSNWLFTWLAFWVTIASYDHFEPQRWLEVIVLLVLVITSVSITFYFFPGLASLLPGMNILHATFGHNHLAALLLLALPISWWWVDRQVSMGETRWLLLLPMILFIALLLSFGRIAIAIGFGELVALFLIYRKTVAAKISYQVLQLFLILFGLVILMKAGLSIALSFSYLSCPVPALERQLCKPIIDEFRPRYWLRAVRIAVDNPWLGTGPGTYRIASFKYREVMSSTTAFAHNAFLQAAAEIGIPGGIVFSLLMLTLLITAWKAVPKFTTKPQWQHVVIISLAAIYIDVLFDFDWDFVGILLLSHILLAVLIGSNSPGRLTIFSRIIKPISACLVFVMHAVSTVLITFAGLYLITSMLLTRNRIELVAKTFPYFYWQRKIFELQTNNPTIKAVLLDVYGAHQDIFPMLISQSSDDAETQQFKERLLFLDPWSGIAQDPVKYFLDKKDLENADRVLGVIVEFVNATEKTMPNQFTYEHKQKLAKQMLVLADSQYLQGRPIEAAKWYKSSRWANERMLAEHKPVFLSDQAEASDRVSFLRSVTEIPGTYFGQYREAYADKYLDSLAEVVRKRGGDQSILIDAQQIVQLAEWKKIVLWEKIGRGLIDRSEVLLQAEEDMYAQDQANLAYGLYLQLFDSQIEQTWREQERLASLLVQLGNRFWQHNIDLTVGNYARAVQLNKWQLSVNRLWFETSDGEIVSNSMFETSTIAAYLRGMDDSLVLQELDWQTANKHRLLNAILIYRLIAEEKYEELNEFMNLIMTWEQSTGATNETAAGIVRAAASEAIARQEQALAQKLSMLELNLKQGETE